MRESLNRRLDASARVHHVPFRFMRLAKCDDETYRAGLGTLEITNRLFLPRASLWAGDPAASWPAQRLLPLINRLAFELNSARNKLIAPTVAGLRPSWRGGMYVATIRRRVKNRAGMRAAGADQ